MRILLLLAALAAIAPAQTRPLSLDDLHKLRTVADPQVSPDGKWVAYTVESANLEDDKEEKHIWMAAWDGSGRVQLTVSKESESAPRWSPDGKWLGFVSDRTAKEKGEQVWLLPRVGGEAAQLTNIEGAVSDFAWSPDSRRLLLLVGPKPEEEKKPDGKPRTPDPVVIDRYRFKRDIDGYLHRLPAQLWLFDLETRKAEKLTKEEYEASIGAWSPDGKRIAFASDRAGGNGARPQWQICVAGAAPASAVTVLTRDDRMIGHEGRLQWSGDGSRIYFQLGRESKYNAYDRAKLASVPIAGGPVTTLTPDLDRHIETIERLSSGEVAFLTVDDMTELPYKIDEGGSRPRRMLEARHTVSALSEASGHVALLAASDERPPGIYALENGTIRPLSAENDWLAQVTLGETREIRYKTPDGAEVHGLLTLPPGYQAGPKLPLLLRIHGGPNGQDEHAFHFERQLFAANGYAVLNVNYRGSSGRDEAFQTAIFADWGGKEVIDLLAGVDHIVSMGIADPARLGIGGWSYGGILTDCVISRDHRFKAAIAGAGSALQLAMYGSDQYVDQYEIELGAPWKNRDLWLKVSYPFFQADKIRTPTLFMGGGSDFNVPIIGSEQMYQALKSNGVDTQLVIYPGEFHGIKKPSYLRDRLERYLAWYRKYLGAVSTAGAGM
jgi:dipeptidyl aminopeptidase/acylaminoacyl peptidase